MFPVGSVVHLTATFKDATGTLVDPTAVTVVITKPDATTLTPAAVKDSTGTYHYDYTSTLVGQHQFYFAGTGTNAAVQAPDVFTVGALTTGALVSIADAKLQLNKSSTLTADDSEILAYIQAATDIINRECGYTAPTQFVETVAATVDGTGHRVLMLSRTPVLSVQSITSRMQGMPAIDISSLNINTEAGVVYLGNWFSWYGPQLVTYTAGRSVVPTVLQQACLIIVQHLWETQQGASTVPTFGGGDDSPIPGYVGLPNRAIELMRMAPYFAAPGIA